MVASKETPGEESFSFVSRLGENGEIWYPRDHIDQVENCARGFGSCLIDFGLKCMMEEGERREL